ncbi:FtsX-like permease family protein [compost metagenome]
MSFWWNHKERFLISLLGILIISSGLTLLFNLSETNKGTVIDTLQNKWNVSYHILVYPPEIDITDKQNGLIEPNFPGGIYGGITLDQLDIIKKIPEVNVAAPLSVLGYALVDFKLDEKVELDKYGIYRSKLQIHANNGVEDQVTNSLTSYIAYSPWQSSETFTQYGIRGLSGKSVDQYAYDYTLIVGIDPVEENKLVGLEQSVTSLPNGNNRYFDLSDTSNVKSLDKGYFGSYKVVDLPILVSSQILANKSFTYTYERLDLPFETSEQAEESMEKVRESGAIEYLDHLSGQDKQIQTFKSEQISNQLLSSLSKSGESPGLLLSQKATSLTFGSISNPFSDKWLYAYELKKYDDKNFNNIDQFPEYYRPYEKLIDPDHPSATTAAVLIPNYIGMYNPIDLNIDKNIDNAYPMDTYSTPLAKQVLDKQGNPINPQHPIYSINNPLGFMTSPPTMLTTLEATSRIMRDSPISVIRVKVSGVDKVTEDNQIKLEQIASSIRKATGLSTEITFASSPQPVLIHVPESGNQSKIGWIEQQWIKLGVAFTLVNEVNVGFSGMLLLVISVAIIYVYTTSFILFLVRKKQFAVLLTLGWRNSKIVWLLIVEALFFGIISALVIWSIEGYFIIVHEQSILLTRYISIGLCGVVIYLFGVITPVFLLYRISPIDVLKNGELHAPPRRFLRVSNLFSLACSNFIGKIKRNLLSSLSMMIPIILLIFFAFVTVRLKGRFYTSWLGQFAVAEIGSLHYIVICICVIISILTTAEIIWQNVSERRSELSLLQALGWKNSSIVRLVMLEGIITGFCAAIFSVLIGFIFISVVYRQFPLFEAWYLLIIGCAPILMGLISSLLPAYKIVTSRTQKGLANDISSTKHLKILMTIGLCTLLIAFSSISMMSIRHLLLTHSGDPDIESVVSSSSHNEASMNKSKVIGNLSDFTPEYITNESKASYDLSLKMNEEGIFTTHAKIRVSNNSEDNWDKLVFYMIPNVFTVEGHSQTYRSNAKLTIKEIMINGNHVSHKLEWDTLTIPLIDKLGTLDQVEVDINYEFEVPEKGIRFTRIGNSYDLAQWYPMLATYNEGWNKQPYQSRIESHLTDFSDFTLNYELLEGYRLISSSEEDSKELSSSGKVTVNHIKELMAIVSKDLEPTSKTIDGIDLNVWGGEKDKEKTEEAVNIASKALKYFNNQIGSYPYKQLDIVIGDRISMEYPGIVTVNTGENFRHTLVHEIAHQWFYGVVSNDPYSDGWLDEGMTELSTSLFFDDYSYAEQHFNPKQQFSNIPVPEMGPGEIVSYYYAQPVLKFKELFKYYETDGATFLKAYFNTFKYRQVDTKSFVKFVEVYFNMDDDSFFEDWIRY